MIVKMQKVTLLLFHKHVDSALGYLKGLGLMHIKHMKEPAADAISNCEHRLQIINRAINLLGDSKTQSQGLDKEHISFYVKEVIILDRKKYELTALLKELQDKQVWFEEWGDVSSHSLDELRRSGVFVKLYIGTKNDLKNLPKDKLVYCLRKNRRGVYLAAFFSSKEESLDLEEIEVPSESLHSLQRKVIAVQKELEEIDKELAKASTYRGQFIEHKKDILKRLELYQVRFGMVHQEEIYCLQGFCPQESVPEISKVAKEQGWAIVSEEPVDEDEVPTLIRNPRWVKIINPVFNFMGTLPGYGEYDISFWFFLFFSLFFAMLIGDAGYGVIFLIATFFMRRKFKKAPSEPFFLMYVLSTGTLIWGAVTGTWFGAEKIAQLPVFSYLVIGRIDSFVGSNQNFMIYLCFLIGAIHLTIAHGIVAFKYINSVLALAQVGWMLMIWAIFFIASNLVLGKVLPGFALNLGAIGVGLVVLFSNPRKNILKGIALSLAELPLKTISSFSDVVSYLRLFAVGYATVAVASTFNSMALGSGINNVLGGLIAALILFFGHTLNMILGLMAVIVHGIRLNMLEFSGHLNMQWSGKEYKPFKE